MIKFHASPPSLPAALALPVPDGRRRREEGTDSVSAVVPAAAYILFPLFAVAVVLPLRGLTVQSGARVEERRPGIVVAKQDDTRKNLHMSGIGRYYRLLQWLGEMI